MSRQRKTLYNLFRGNVQKTHSNHNMKTQSEHHGSLHAMKILKILYFHNIFQYQVHTEICTFHMVTTST